MKKIIYTAGIFLSVIMLGYYISGLFQVYNNPINSKYVLIEGWIPKCVLEEIALDILKNKIDSIFIVGMKYENDIIPELAQPDKDRISLKKRNGRYSIPWDGSQVFVMPATKDAGPINIEIGMFGTKALNLYPHYKIFVNNDFLGSGFVTKNDSAYRVVYHQKKNDTILNLKISFDNDVRVTPEDRNLYLTKIKIGSRDIDSLTTGNYFIFQDGKLSANFDSDASGLKLYLHDLGIDTTTITTIVSDNNPLNKTLALAKAAKQYFEKTDIDNINIYAAHYHSMRTFINFNHCLEDFMNVGCIATGYKNEETKKPIFGKIDERISLLATWIYWWFH